MSKHYAISVSDPTPAMTVTYTSAAVETYAEAVAAAHTMHRVTGRTVCLFSAHASGTPQTYYWHRIVNGEFIDRNTNSGVPKTGHVA